jgi:hypothetical protein
MATFRIRKLNNGNVNDFFAVNCAKNGLEWCNCVAWWCDNWEKFGARSAEENRQHRETLFSRGEFDGFLLYEDDLPIGWSQVGPRNRLPNLVKMYGADPRDNVTAVTCFALRPEYRRKGVVTEFLNLIVSELKATENRVIQGFPKRETKDPWTGPESSFMKCGFVKVVEHEKFPIYEINHKTKS